MATAARVLLSWPDGHGNYKFASTRCLDFSRSGLRLESPEPLKLRSYVTIRSDELKLACSASVRYCQGSGLRYSVGLEFSQPLRPDHPVLGESASDSEPVAKPD